MEILEMTVSLDQSDQGDWVASLITSDLADFFGTSGNTISEAMAELGKEIEQRVDGT